MSAPSSRPTRSSPRPFGRLGGALRLLAIVAVAGCSETIWDEAMEGEALDLLPESVASRSPDDEVEAGASDPRGGAPPTAGRLPDGADRPARGAPQDSAAAGSEPPQPTEASASPAPPAPPPELEEPVPDAPGRTPLVEDPEALAPFFAALAHVEAGQGVARVTHMGDSSIGMDGLPHFLRTHFQERYGDAGPGFVLMQPHSPSYRNRTVRLLNDRPWADLCFITHRCLRDGHYGLGGVTVESVGGAVTSIRPQPGRRVSRAELWYAGQPRGGRLTFRFGTPDAVTIDTSAEALEDRWHVLEREPGDHVVRVRAGGRVRAYGVVLENDGPGVVWDTLSMIGAFTPRLLQHDEAHFARQLQRRDPDLVVLNYGGNDLRRLVGGAVSREGFREETRRLMARVRRALPDASCLLVGINDHERSGDLDIRPTDVEGLVVAQREAAEAAGCAFWSTLDAMGGPGSYRRWRRRALAGADAKHLSQRGRRVVAARLYAALEHARRLQSRGEPASAGLPRAQRAETMRP